MENKRIFNKVITVILTLLLFINNSVLITHAEELDEGAFVSSFVISKDITNQELEVGSSEENINLPSTLTIKTSDEQEQEVNVSWSLDVSNSSSETFNSDTVGNKYVYVSTITDENYALSEEANYPTITVTIINKQEEPINEDGTLVVAEDSTPTLNESLSVPTDINISKGTTSEDGSISTILSWSILNSENISKYEYQYKFVNEEWGSVYSSVQTTNNSNSVTINNHDLTNANRVYRVRSIDNNGNYSNWSYELESIKDKDALSSFFSSEDSKYGVVTTDISSTNGIPNFTVKGTKTLYLQGMIQFTPGDGNRGKTLITLSDNSTLNLFSIDDDENNEHGVYVSDGTAFTLGANATLNINGGYYTSYNASYNSTVPQYPAPTFRMKGNESTVNITNGHFRSNSTYIATQEYNITSTIKIDSGYFDCGYSQIISGPTVEYLNGHVLALTGNVDTYGLWFSTDHPVWNYVVGDPSDFEIKIGSMYYVDVHAVMLNLSSTATYRELTVLKDITKESTISKENISLNLNNHKVDNLKVTAKGTTIKGSGKLDSLSVESPGTVNIVGGSYKFDPTGYVNTNIYTVSGPDSEGYYTVSPKNEVVVKTFDELKNAINEESVTKITIGASFSFKESVTIKDTKTIDLSSYRLTTNSSSCSKCTINVGDSTNNVTLTIEASGSGRLYGDNNTIIEVAKGSTLNLNNGQIELDKPSQKGVPAVQVYGTLNMSGGGIRIEDSISAGVLVSSGILNISGGAIYAAPGSYNPRAITTTNSSTINITGGKFYNYSGSEINIYSGSPTISISGGSFGHNFSDSSSNTNNTSWLADNVTVHTTSETYYKYEVIETYDVVLIDSNGTETKYLKLKDAINNATDGSTIKLLHVSLNKNDEESELKAKNVTLDLNGYGTNIYTYPIVVSGSLTIEDSSEDKTGFINDGSTNLFSVTSTGSLTLKSGELKGTSIILDIDGGSFIMNGGKLSLSKPSSSYNSVYVLKAINASNSSTITINGGLINIDAQRGTYESTTTKWTLYGIYSTSSTLNINGTYTGALGESGSGTFSTKFTSTSNNNTYHKMILVSVQDGSANISNTYMSNNNYDDIDLGVYSKANVTLSDNNYFVGQGNVIDMSYSTLTINNGWYIHNSSQSSSYNYNAIRSASSTLTINDGVFEVLGSNTGIQGQYDVIYMSGDKNVETNVTNINGGYFYHSSTAMYIYDVNAMSGTLNINGGYFDQKTNERSQYYPLLKVPTYDNDAEKGRCNIRGGVFKSGIFVVPKIKEDEGFKPIYYSDSKETSPTSIHGSTYFLYVKGTLQPPTNLKLDTSNNTYVLSFTKPSDFGLKDNEKASSYIVEYSTDSSFSSNSTVYQLTTTSTSVTIPSDNLEDAYKFYVRVRSKSDNDTYSIWLQETFTSINKEVVIDNIDDFKKVIGDTNITKITLSKDMTLDSNINISSDKTIDLNGKTLTVSTNKAYSMYVKEGGKLTVTDSSEGASGVLTGGRATVLNVVEGGELILDKGNIKLESSYTLTNTSGSVAATVEVYGKLTVNEANLSVKLSSSDYSSAILVRSDSAEVNVNGGSVKGESKYNRAITYVTGESKINITGGSFSSSSAGDIYGSYNANIVVTGGKFKHDFSTNDKYNSIYGNQNIYLRDANGTYVSNYVDNTDDDKEAYPYVVTSKPGVKDDKGNEYLNLKTALANASEGATLTMQYSQPYGNNLECTVNKNLTLDLNGYSANIMNYPIIIDGGSITLKDSGTTGILTSKDSTGYKKDSVSIFKVINGALTVESGSLETDVNTIHADGTSASVIVNGGTINDIKNGGGVNIEYLSGIYLDNGAKATVTGGSFNAYNLNNAATLDIHSGEYSNYTRSKITTSCISVNNGSSLIMTNGVMENTSPGRAYDYYNGREYYYKNYVVYVNKATVDISGGKMTGNNGGGIYLVNEGTNATLSGTLEVSSKDSDAISIYARANATINGGTYTSLKGEYENSQVIGCENSKTVVINGGTFTTDRTNSNGIGLVFLRSYVENNSFTINGGIFTSEDINGYVIYAGGYNDYTNLYVNGGYFHIATEKNSSTASKATIVSWSKAYVNGGKYSNYNKNATNIILPEGYAYNINNDEDKTTYPYVVGPSANAKYQVVDSNGNLVGAYETFTSALEKASKDYTIKLINDETLDSTITVSKDITIDLNGKKLSGSVDPLIDVTDSHNLTITDTSSDKSGSIESDSGDLIRILNDKSNVIINNGSLKVTKDDKSVVVFGSNDTTATNSSLIVNGGKLESSKGTVVSNRNDSNSDNKVTIYDGNFVSGTKDTNRLSIFDNSKISYEVIDGNFDSGDTQTFSAEPSSEVTANVKISGGIFTSKSGLLNDNNQTTSYIEEGYSVSTIEKNNKTYYKVDATVENIVATVNTPSGNSKAYSSLQDAIDGAGDGSTVTLKEDETIDESITIDKSITIDLNNNTISSSKGTNSEDATISIEKGLGEVNVTIKNGTITDCTDENKTTTGYSIDVGKDTKIELVNVTTGKIKNEGSLDIDKDSKTGEIDSSGTTKTSGETGDINVTDGTTNINDGNTGNVKVTGGNANINGGDSKDVEIIDGELDITGGNVDNVKTTGGETDISGGNIDGNITVGPDTSVDISGGDINGKVTLEEGTDGKKGTVNATGGNFKEDPSDIITVDENHTIKKVTGDDGSITYEVVEKTDEEKELDEYKKTISNELTNYATAQNKEVSKLNGDGLDSDGVKKYQDLIYSVKDDSISDINKATSKDEIDKALENAKKQIDNLVNNAKTEASGDVLAAFKSIYCELIDGEADDIKEYINSLGDKLTSDQKESLLDEVEDISNTYKLMINFADNADDAFNAELFGDLALSAIKSEADDLVSKNEKVADLKEKADEVTNYINDNSDNLTDSQKSSLLYETDSTYTDYSKKILEADDLDSAETNKTDGINELEAIKDKVDLRINKNDNIALLNNEVESVKSYVNSTSNNLSDTQKEELINEATDTYKKYESLINDSVDSTDSDNNKNLGLDALSSILSKVDDVDNKNDLIALLKAKADEVTTYINDNSSKITESLKKDLLEEKDSTYNDYSNKISNAEDLSKATSAKDEGVDKLNAIKVKLDLSVNKSENIKSLEDKVTEVKEYINSTSNNLSNTQKEELIKKVDSIYSDYKEQINEAKSIDDSNNAKYSGISSLGNIKNDVDTLTSKNNLVTSLKEKADEVTKYINDNSSKITESQKNSLLNETNSIYNDYTDKILNADSLDSANTIKDEGVTKLDEIKTKTDLVKDKNDKVSSLKDKASKVIDEINKLDNLTSDEKKSYIEEVTSELNEAIGKINNSTSTDDVQSAYNDGLNELEDTNTSAKDKAEKNLKDKKAALEKELNKEVNKSTKKLNEQINDSLSNIKDETKKEEYNKLIDEAKKSMDEAKNKADESIKDSDSITDLDDVDIDSDLDKAKAITDLVSTGIGKSGLIDSLNGLNDQKDESGKDKATSYTDTITDAVKDAVNKLTDTSKDLTSEEIEKIVDEVKSTIDSTVKKAREEARKNITYTNKLAGEVVNSTDASTNANNANLEFNTKNTYKDESVLADNEIEKVLTDSDIAKIDNGSTINIYVKVIDVNENTNNTETKNEIESIKSEIKDIVEDDSKLTYLDVSMYKEIITNNSDGTTVSQGQTKVTGTNNNVTIAMSIPKESLNTDSSKIRSYQIVRAHNEDGDIETEIIDCKYNESTKTITFETDKFSTYALIYTDKDKVIDNTSNNNNNNNNSSNKTANTCEEAIGRNWTWSNKSKTCVYRVKNTNTK